jgi:biopolymer transport protein ExbD
MAIRRRAQPVGELSQASLSDIAFLLLIFFIATTIFPTEQGIPLILPGATSNVAQIHRSNVMVIHTDETGSVFVDDTPFPVEALRAEVERRSRENDKLVISIETDAEAPYKSMVAVLDQVKLAGATKISIKMFRG